jgi:hypothetical protein
MPDAASRHIVTGRGPQSGPPRRDVRRGGRDGAPSGRDTSSPGSSRSGSGRAPVEPVRPWVEVEELPTQSLAPNARSRVSLTAAIAVVAVAVLLAGGFGLLGGRSAGTAESPPPASLVAGQPSAEPNATEPPPVPRVTPWANCSASPDEPPEAVLEVDGVKAFGTVEPPVFDLGKTFSPDATVLGEDELGGPVEVPIDAITDIWIVGGACAVAWNIDLVGSDVPGGLQTIESVSNEDRDPAVSAQNRFQLFVAPYPGDHQLRAVLVFDEFAVRLTWSIHVPALEPPNVTLTAERGEIPTVIGCDVRQRLANDVEVPLSPCDLDVRRAPAQRVEVAPGEFLQFAIEGWNTDDTSINCGLLIDRRFFPRTQPACVRALDPLFDDVRFPAPEEAGRWTLAMSTCAWRIRDSGEGADQLCGTWYANVLVRD